MLYGNPMWKLKRTPFLLCTTVIVLLIIIGCPLQTKSDEQVLREEFRIPESAELLRLKAFPEKADHFGREGLKIDAVFKFNSDDFQTYRSQAEKSGNWKQLPVPKDFLIKMGGLKFKRQYFKDLTEEWQRRMKREYWPDIADRKEPGEIAKELTDHREDRSYMNSSAAISPQGDKIIFLSNRDGKMSIYLMDVLDGKIIRKLIQGEADVNFEELHFLEPGFGWSPDGKKITLAAKSGDTDAIYIYDLESRNYDEYDFDLDGIFATTWSPIGN